jgi:hypothetical protein
MSVDVADGAVIIEGKTSADAQGCYFCDNFGAQNVTIAPAHPTLPRRDVIIATVADDQYAPGVPGWSLVSVTGTAAASPAYPPLTPANGNYFALAGVDVAAGATSITNANITQIQVGGGAGLPVNRGYAAALGGRIVATSGSAPSTGLTAPLTNGIEYYETDTGRFYTRDGSSWINTGSAKAGLSWATSITQGSSVAHVTNMARFERRGRWISGQLHLTVNGTGTLNSAIRVGAPQSRGYAFNHAAGQGYVTDASTGFIYPVIAYFDAPSTFGLIRSAVDGTGAVFLGPSGLTQLAAGDIISLSFAYEANA